ncbi:MAG: anaerobic ribonucleoside-triphosphate reductase activating protein [Lachnospiraceae bacterium]|nr:anaerobic ribonucleoside-triphosphate reductase activating protein [Lachnospiraceae bacterium]
MKYSGLIRNDLAAAPGISVSFFVQGCPHKCKGCHNPETWDFNGGKEFTQAVLDEIIEALRANDVERSFCIMGGEPLCEENIFLVYLVLQYVKQHLPDTKIYVWTGYYYDELLKRSEPKLHLILGMADYLIDGPYVESMRDLSLQMRGSSNQSIIELKGEE